MRYAATLALLIVALATPANAAHRHRSHDPMVNMLAYGFAQMLHSERMAYEPYRHRHRAIRHHRRSYGHHGGFGNLVARSGARASVSAVARPHFQCLVDRLEAAGYRIDFMGGFARRSNPSAHPTGNAVDINQTGFGRVTRRFPGNVEAMCQACGVYSGGHFGDYGHFEMPRKYGYVNVGRRYAYRQWRRRSYARAWW